MDNENMVECVCDAWKNSHDSIQSVNQFAAMHGAGYTGADWVYCPFCGSELVEVEE